MFSIPPRNAIAQYRTPLFLSCDEISKSPLQNQNICIQRIHHLRLLITILLRTVKWDSCIHYCDVQLDRLENT